MNKRITHKYIILASSCLLISTHALADRPAMSERDEPVEPEIINISTDLEPVPVFEEMPVQDASSRMEGTSIAEDSPSMEATPEVEMIPPAAETNNKLEQTDEVEPVIQVYDHRTETENTGDVIELQSGDTLPVRVLDFPRRGMTMDKVKNELGPALSVSDAIGDPPITTWTYSDRIVYFEFDRVIHVVSIN